MNAAKGKAAFTETVSVQGFLEACVPVVLQTMHEAIGCVCVWLLFRSVLTWRSLGISCGGRECGGNLMPELAGSGNSGTRVRRCMRLLAAEHRNSLQNNSEVKTRDARGACPSSR